MLYLTLKERLFLQSLNAIIYEKKIILASGKGKADPLTKCSGKRVYSPFEEAGERKLQGLPQ